MYAIQLDERVYCCDPVGAPELFDDWLEWNLVELYDDWLEFSVTVC